MKKKKYLAIFMAMSMATATAPVTALADGADTTGTESGAGAEGGTGTGESGSGEAGSENGGTEGGSTTAPEESKIDSFDKLEAAIEAAEAGETIKLAADITGEVVVPEGVNITIDLNGKKITNSVGHTIMKNGTLTMEVEGTVDNITHGKAALDNKVTVT